MNVRSESSDGHPFPANTGYAGVYRKNQRWRAVRRPLVRRGAPIRRGAWQRAWQSLSFRVALFVRYRLRGAYMTDYDGKVGEFAQRHHLEFRDLNLLRTALTHRSFLNEHPEYGWEDNERLEFLGDAVLDFMVAEYLYLHFPDASEGDMTNLRAVLVRRPTLAGFARDMEVGRFLLMGHGEAESGGRQRAATLCASFEALVGAVYLDQGLAGVAEMVFPRIERELAGARVEAEDKDPKSRLQELAQAIYGLTPRYRTARAEGPDHAKLFTVEVTIADEVLGSGEGPNKQDAAQQAATNALGRRDEWPGLEIVAQAAGGPVAVAPDPVPPVEGAAPAAGEAGAEGQGEA